ncbi:YjfA family protein [Bacillus mobilis]
MFKKLMKVCALSVVSVGVLFSFQESTFAATDLSSYYDGKNPATTKVYGGSTTCDADGFNAKSTAVYEGSKKVGTVYLRYSNKCHAAWSKLVLDQPAPSVSGGNGVVNKGQTSCYTPMVYDLDPRKAQEQGKHAIPNSDAYNYAETIWY